MRILGMVDASVDGVSISLGGPRERLVLSMLALSQGQVVGRDRMIDAIWESDPPESAVTQVAIHISRLRKELTRADIIDTVGQGYRLVTNGVEVDATVAHRLLQEARETQNSQLFRDALAMWRGPVLDGVDSAAIAASAQRLDELYLTGVEDWSAVELDSGGERALLEVLPDVVARHPLREGLRARLMEALWRSGRRAEALGCYDGGRRALVDELGIDPGDELTRLHHQILQETAPSAEPADLARPVSEGTWTADVPRQLPIDVTHFAGRADDVALVRSQLLADGRHSVVIGVHGPGGVGKTTLAVHVAHQMADQFPDGQLFVNLRGYGAGDPVDASTALGSMLRAFGVPEREIPTEENDRSRLLRSILAGRRILLVLDNARDSFQVRPLLPGGSVAVLVTSRMQMRSLATREGAQRIHVKEMTSNEAVDLLHSRRSPQTQWAEPDVAELARLCGHLPVALAVAAERANRYPDRPLSELNTELRDGHAALDTLTAWEDDPATSVRAVMAWSIDALGADEARMFRLLGLHPHPALDVHAAGALVGLDLSAAARLLDRLVDSHLVTERRPREYEMHDLVHAFAAQLAVAHVGESERDEAVTRMRAMYVHTLGNAGSSFIGRPLRIPLSPLPDRVTPVTFGEPGQTRRWFNDNERRLRVVLDEASASSDHSHALMLAVHVAFLLMEYGRTHDGLRMNRIAEAHARQSGDPHAEALCAFRLGAALWHAGDFASALDQFTAAHQSYTQLGSTEPALRALMATGVVLAELGRDDESTRVQEAAVASARSHDRVTSEMLNNLAMEFVKVGRAREALTLAEEAVDIARREREALFEVGALDTIGLAYLQLGEHLQALQAFEQALACDRAWPNILQPYVFMNRGLALRALGRHNDARESWYRALRLMDELDVRDSNMIHRSELRELLQEMDDESASPDDSTQRPRQS